MAKRLLFFWLCLVPALAPAQTPVYKDPAQPIDARVKDLLARMTLDEKVAQTFCIWQKRNEFLYDDQGRFDPEKAKRTMPHGMGQVARPSENRQGMFAGPGRNARQMAEITNAIQRYFVEQTRLGIPVIFHEEALHGLPAKDATSFPQAIGLASTFDDELAFRIFTAVAHEVRSRGGHQVLAPVVDVARDPRWGRFEETYGEDPYLASRLGVAAVRGFQGNAAQGIDGQHVIATLKHITGHGQPEAGNNIAPANTGERQMREMFLPPFEAAIKEAGALSVMPSYNEIDGVPSHASEFLLQRILRQEWGFQGTVVSDYGAITDLYSRHRLVPDEPATGPLAFKAGVDVEMPDYKVFTHLKTAVETGKLPLATLDQAVGRILRAKFLLGLFERPYVDPALAERVSGSEAHAKLAREAAEKAMVLLQNRNALLPLDLAKLKKIAVIGPNADRPQLGGYSDVPKYVVTLRQGIAAKVGQAAQVLYTEGCRLIEERDPQRWYRDQNTLPKPAEDDARLAEAVKVAAQADVIVLALGSDEGLTREGWAENHLGDRPSLELFGRQNELLDRLAALNKPIVVVLFNGAPLALQNVQAKAGAVLECWYLGQEGGHAVADALFGTVNPSGKLPCTFPASAGHIPAFYNHKPSARRGYHFTDVQPLFPFGFGLSYTSFDLSKPVLEKAAIKAGETAKVTVTVTNTGRVAGTEVVQLYLRDVVASVTRPVKELKGFARVSLRPGEAKTITLTITPDQLALWDLQMRRVTEPGDFEVKVGTSSADRDLQKVVLRVE
jgi:beta-glucosidase